MADEEIKKAQEEARLDAALTIVKDIMFRLEDDTEGKFSVYDMLSYLTEDLIREGSCAACMKEAFDAAIEQTGADTSEHRTEGDAVYH